MKRIAPIVYFCLCFLLLFSTTAQAYIDPAVTSYLVQAIAGVAIAIGAVVTLYWRRAKKKVAEKLGVEENQAKEVEDEIVAFSKESPEGKDQP